MKIRFQLPKTYRSKQIIRDHIATYCESTTLLQNSKNYPLVSVLRRRRLEQAVAACSSLDLNASKQQLVQVYHSLLLAWGYVYEDLANIITGQKANSYDGLSKSLRLQLVKILKQSENLVEDPKATKLQLGTSLFDLKKAFYAAYQELLLLQKKD